MAINKESLKINTDEIKGRAKVAAGAVTGNKDLENEGQIDRYVGQAKNFNAELAAGSRTTLPLGRDGVPVSHLPLSFDHLRRSLLTLEDSAQP